MNQLRTKKWKCSVEANFPNKRLIQCESKEGKLLTAFDDGTIRFSSNDSVKIDGKTKRGVLGVELE